MIHKAACVPERVPVRRWEGIRRPTCSCLEAWGEDWLRRDAPRSWKARVCFQARDIPSIAYEDPFPAGVLAFGTGERIPVENDPAGVLCLRFWCAGGAQPLAQC